MTRPALAGAAACRAARSRAAACRAAACWAARSRAAVGRAAARDAAGRSAVSGADVHRGAVIRAAAGRWSATLLLAVVTTLLAAAGPASAHAGGLTATDSRGRVVSVTPAVPGLEITAIEDGARLRLRNRTGTPVTVPTGGGPATPAVVAPGDELTWIDERATPDGRTVAAGRTVTWTVPLDAGGITVTVHGVLVGEPRPASALWWVAAALTGTGIVLLARRLRRADLLLATAGTVAAIASAAHVAGSALAVESAPFAGTFLNAAGINLLAWPMIIGGVVTAVRGRAAGLLAVCAGAALTAVFVLPDVTSFHRAVLPFAGPAVIERILVVLALGLGAGVAVAGAGVLRDLARQAEDQHRAGSDQQRADNDLRCTDGDPQGAGDHRGTDDDRETGEQRAVGDQRVAGHRQAADERRAAGTPPAGGGEQHVATAGA